MNDEPQSQTLVSRSITPSVRMLSLPALLVLALGIRLPSALFFGNPYDFEIWRSYARLVWRFDVNALFWWSQGPLALISLALFVAPAVAIGGLAGTLPPEIENLFLHLPFIAGDLLLGYGLWRLCRAIKPSWRRTALAAWAFVPGFWWVSAVHGQFDPWIPATLLLSTLDTLDRRWTRAGFWLGIGIGFKYVPGILLPGLVLLALHDHGRGAAWKILRASIITAVLVLLPLLLTAFLTGASEGTHLLAQRVGWWTVGTDSPVLEASTLAQASSTPYPVLLGVLKGLGMPNARIGFLPPLLVTSGAVCSLAWFARRVFRRRNFDDFRDRLPDLLTYEALTLLFVGGLSQVSVLQRLYWSLPMLLALAVVKQSIASFTVVSVFSYLYLLPEWYGTSPMLYLRAPLDDAGLTAAATLNSWTGFGTSPHLALLVGATLVPLGLLAILLARQAHWPLGNASLISLTAANIALVALLRPTIDRAVGFGVAIPLGILIILLSRAASSLRPIIFALLITVALTVTIAGGEQWAATLVTGRS